jgi:hypothetical protein
MWCVCVAVREDGFLRFYTQAASDRPAAAWHDFERFGFARDFSCTEELLLTRRKLAAVGPSIRKLLEEMEDLGYGTKPLFALVSPNRPQQFGEVKLYQVLAACNFDTDLAVDSLLRLAAERAAANLKSAAPAPAAAAPAAHT